jgi:pheromone shutdown protein TraB
MKKKIFGFTSLQLLKKAYVVENKENSYLAVELDQGNFLISLDNNGNALELKKYSGESVAVLFLTERGLVKFTKLHEELFNIIQG